MSDPTPYPYTPSTQFVFYAYAYGMEYGPFPPLPADRLAQRRGEFDRWATQNGVTSDE